MKYVKGLELRIAELEMQVSKLYSLIDGIMNLPDNNHDKADRIVYNEIRINTKLPELEKIISDLKLEIEEMGDE